jgi:ketosteroid isomerase-like protein
MRLTFVAAISALMASVANAHPAQHARAAPAGALSPAARSAAHAVDRFHEALRRGDAEAAAAWLANDALIFEAGRAERTKAEYVAHHLPADAAFSRSVSARMTRRAGSSNGALAWIATEGRTNGTYKGKPVDLNTTETMILRRGGNGWRIFHIHWSSAAKR